MKIIADTHVLLRAIVGDDAKQSAAAIEAMIKAETVAVSLHALCEMVWVLHRRYDTSRANIASTLRLLLRTHNVQLNRAAVEAGLAMLDMGGDFADGVIAYEGQWLGGEIFVSFDQKAVSALNAQGKAARLL